jgi:hypothetical protein
MNRKLNSFMLILFLSVFSCLSANDDLIFLKRLAIKGNDVTRESYIRSLITLKEGETYDLNTVIDEINKSISNLKSTELFTNVFFNDEMDDENNLILTVQLREKNYLHFGPDGYFIYEDRSLYFNTRLYLSYINMFGVSDSITLRLPLYVGISDSTSIYENTGVLINYSGSWDKLIYKADFEFLYSFPNSSFPNNSSWYFLSPVIGYRINDNLNAGIRLTFNYNDIYTVFFSPYFELGSSHSSKVKTRYFTSIAPFYGHNFTGTSSQGINSVFQLHRELFFQIVYSVYLDVNLQRGKIPENFILRSSVRGTHYDLYRGSRRISLSNELNIPLPWNNDLVIVPFVDTNLIGRDSYRFLIGGGAGLHWYTRFQDPLIIEVAYGKGLMLNFQKIF